MDLSHENKNLEPGEPLPESQEHEGASPAVFSFTDLGKKRDDFVKKVQDRANMMVETAKKQADQIKTFAAKKGYEEGFNKGLQEGLEKGREESISKAEADTASLRSLLENIGNELQSHRELIRGQAETELLKLAVLVAEKILKHELKFEEIAARVNVREAIHLASERSHVRIFVSPDDLDMMKEFEPTLMREFADIEGIDFIADSEITRGGCIVATHSGKVDMRIETQLAEIEKELTE